VAEGRPAAPRVKGHSTATIAMPEV
jgi:hypothetical protein